MRLSVPGLPQPGATVGSYVIERVAGSGGMSVVFEARHQGLGKRVALKMLLPHYAADGETARRFSREGASAAKIEHPNAVDVTDVGRDESGAPFLVMEYLEGEDLASLLEHTGRLTVEETADILVPVISALSAAHELGIVHRDLKPQNIMLAQRRREVVPKVVDFGISKVLEESVQLTGTQALLGTPKYMSPEQAKGAGKVDARSDQFALGSVLYECLTGQAAFEAETVYGVIAQVVECKYRKPRELVPELPKEVEAILLRVLRQEPKARYADMRALGGALLPFASMRVQLGYASDFDASAPSAGRGSRTRVRAAETEQSGTRKTSSAVAAIAQTATVARTWLTAGGPRRAWGVAALSTLVAVLGVALPVMLIAMRDHETRPTPSVVDASHSEGSGSRQAEPTPKLPSDPRTEENVPPVDPPRSDPVPAPEPKATPTFEVDLTVDPSTAWFSLDGKAAGAGRLRRTLPVDGKVHELLIGARGYRMRTVRFKDAPPPEALALEKSAPQKGKNDALILR